jgi:hypothetical protein
MKKLILRFFLPLCIFLLNGNPLLYAHAVDAEFPAFETHDGALAINAGITPVDLTFISQPSSSGKRQKFAWELAENETEEDEVVSSKKQFPAKALFAAIFYALAFAFFILFIRKRLSLSRHFSDISAYRRHLVFQVFII